MGVRKSIYFSDEEYKKMEEIKAKYGLSSDSAVMRFLLHQGELSEQLANKLVNQLEENYMKSERLKWGVKTAEQNSIVILDAINTMLHMMKAESLISVEFAPHPVVEKSQENLKNKIAHFKQKSDERKRKQGGGH